MHDATRHPFDPVTHPNEGEKVEYSFELPHMWLGTESGCRRGFHDTYHFECKTQSQISNRNPFLFAVPNRKIRSENNLCNSINSTRMSGGSYAGLPLARDDACKAFHSAC
ncbi:hypothetical protein PISMIDRAFT_530684 [Pisolithus microcarpus 441]|uniref:Uncharacterized protein n=1 Tax=Pisolithus microcarpus 441 TaxID=765257 RepID=A0A0C9Y1S5_9AGAM|nr:hypothetical protein BKA83DRAFT_530684 [Pisolithus microcarpus]KIK11156.1 hypothetical protein PISMIDRAFT_530684 [Pisolithus microcarpus 441]